MEFTKTITEEKITLSVTVKCDNLTENVKREIISNVATASHQLYLDVAQELNVQEKILAACDIDEIVDIVAERLGIKPTNGREEEIRKVKVALSDGATPQDVGRIVEARLRISENQET